MLRIADDLLNNIDNILSIIALILLVIILTMLGWMIIKFAIT